jgi:hypothetical protein
MKAKLLVSLQKRTAAKILGFALGLFVVAFTSSGFAGDVLYHASLCNPSTPTGQAHYDQVGVANLSSSSPLSVNCGGVVPFNGNNEIEKVYVQVYDRHPSQDVVCTLRTVGFDGTVFTTNSDFSFGSSLISQTLLLEPFGNTSLGTINLQCTIPPVAPSQPPSHVTSYRVISTP